MTDGTGTGTSDSTAQVTKSTETPKKKAPLKDTISPTIAPMLEIKPLAKTTAKRPREEPDALERWHVVDEHIASDVQATNLWDYTKFQTIRSVRKHFRIQKTSDHMLKVLNTEWGPKARRLVLGADNCDTWPTKCEAQYAFVRMLHHLVKRARCNDRHDAALLTLANIVGCYGSKNQRVVEETENVKAWLKDQVKDQA